MYNRLIAITTTGSVVYAVIRNTSGQVWNGTTFGTYSAGSFSTYAVTLTEQGATGWYSADVPGGITTAGVYHYEANRRVGGSVAVSDPIVFEEKFAVGVGLPAVDSSGRATVFSAKMAASTVADPPAAPTATRLYIDPAVILLATPAVGDTIIFDGGTTSTSATGTLTAYVVAADSYIEYTTTSGFVPSDPSTIYILPPGSAGGNIASDVAAIKAKTDTITADGINGPIAFTVRTVDAAAASVGPVTFSVSGLVGITNTSGTFVGGLATTGSYTFRAAPQNGLLFASVTTNVQSGTTVTLTGSATSITPPSDPDQTTGYVVCYDGSGTVKQGAVLTFRVMRGTGDTGTSFARNEFTATSGSNGLLEVTLAKGARYQATRGTGATEEFTVPSGAGDTYALPAILGQD